MAQVPPSPSRWDRLLVIAIVIAACIAYLPTAQPDISASPHRYFTDVGNVQNALSQWGTLHSSGYPLFSLAGAAFVSIARGLGIAPALGASLFSTVWAIGALVAFYLLLVAWLKNRLVAVGVTALLGLGWAYWLFASYAEVYSLAYFVVMLALYAALKADQTRQVVWLYVLAICLGMVVAHHRAIALVAPAVILLAGPAFWQVARRNLWFVFKWGMLALFVAVVPYLYLWLRAQQPGAWIWGDPTTLAGLWRQMLGETYLRMLVWPTTPAEWGTILQSVMGVWFDIQAWPIVVLGLLSIAWLLWRRQIRYGLACLLGVLVPFGLAVADRTFFGTRRLPEDIPALLLLATIFALFALAYLIDDLMRFHWMRRVTLILVSALAIFLAVQNQPSIFSLTHDDTGRRVIASAQEFVADHQFSTPPAFFSPWGGEFWALSYGRDVTRELQPFDLLPNRADVQQALDRYGIIYTFSDTLYNYGLDWWRKRLGPVYLSSAGVGTIALGTQPPITERALPHPERAAVAMDDASLALRDWQVKPLVDDRWLVTLFWQAAAQPDRDYSVSLKATDREIIDDPDDIVAQADSSAPVHGWYPTSLWSPGEIVRDDYVLAGPFDRPPQTVEISLYTQDAAGNFQNFGRYTIPLR
jgi:hypothetical protein